MKNLKVWQKLVVMGGVFMISFAFVTWRLVSSGNTRVVDVAKREARAVEYYSPVLVLLQEPQLHRSLASTWINGDATARRVTAKSADVGRALAAVDAVGQRLGAELDIASKRSELRRQISDALALPGKAGRQAADSLRRPNGAIDQLNGASPGLKPSVEKFKVT